MYNGGFGAYPQDDMGVNTYFGESDTNFFGDTSNDSFFSEGAGFALDSSDSFFGESAGMDSFDSDFFFESESNTCKGKYGGEISDSARNMSADELAERHALKADATSNAREMRDDAKRRGDKQEEDRWKNIHRERMIDSMDASRKFQEARNREKRLDKFGKEHSNRDKEQNKGSANKM